MEEHEKELYREYVRRMSDTRLEEEFMTVTRQKTPLLIAICDEETRKRDKKVVNT